VPANPLQPNPPSWTILIHYPLVATNVRILCEKEGWRSRGGSLLQTFRAVRLVYQTEGFKGMYRGGEVYLLHQSAREGLRYLMGLCVDGCLRDRPPAEPEPSPGSAAVALRQTLRNQAFWLRVCVKYAIDLLCYPVLLASTRGVLLKGSSPFEALQKVRHWSLLDGTASLWNGATCHLLSIAADEAMELVVGVCIDRTDGVALADKFLIKASAMTVLGVLTTPITHVGTIQRCQSAAVEGLIDCRPLGDVLGSLPWRGLFYQLVIFSGLLVLNVTVLQWKAEIAVQEEQQAELQQRRQQTVEKAEDE